MKTLEYSQYIPKESVLTRNFFLYGLDSTKSTYLRVGAIFTATILSFSNAVYYATPLAFLFKRKKVIAGGGRLYVPSHSAKRFVIAMKYEGEKEYRYLMATNLTWNMKEVMETFSIRWLIEVFFEDWSGYHGFCSLAKQCGEEGSLRPLILSLLFDHCFLFHADQSNLFKQEKPLATFGSLVEKSRAQAFCHVIEKILESDSPKDKLQELVNSIDDLYPLRSSKKHMCGVAA